MQVRFMGTQGYIWFMGIVEDSNDPLRLGRVKVRCYGFHGDKTSLPTNLLPWAIVAQPTISSGFRGGGFSPTALRPGSVVNGFFADGTIAQYPVVTGVMGGINNTGVEGSLTEVQLLQRIEGITDQQESAIPLDSVDTLDTNAVGVLGRLTSSQYTEFKTTIGQIESSNNYKALQSTPIRGNPPTFAIGKYQFLAAALKELGYVKLVQGIKTADLADNSYWTGQDGVTSRNAFLNSNNVQETAADKFAHNLYRTLIRNGTLSPDSSPRQISGFLGVAWLVGGTGARRWSDNNSTQDAGGTNIANRYKTMYNCITDPAPRLN